MNKTKIIHGKASKVSVTANYVHPFLDMSVLNLFLNDFAITLQLDMLTNLDTFI